MLTHFANALRLLIKGDATLGGLMPLPFLICLPV